MKVDLKKLLGQIKNKRSLLIIFILGIALLFIPGVDTNENKETIKDDDFSKYKLELETDLENIISKINGTGAVDVMVTLEDSGLTNYAKNESESTSKTDSQMQKSKDSTHVLKGEGSSRETPLITKKIFPTVSGVLICAEGAKNPQTKNDIIKAAQALLGIKSHRIEVLERK